MLKLPKINSDDQFSVVFIRVSQDLIFDNQKRVLINFIRLVLLQLAWNIFYCIRLTIHKKMSRNDQKKIIKL